MPTQNQDLRYRLLGEDVSAGRTFGKVSDAAKQAHSAISTLGSSLNATGTFTPLLDGMNAVSEGFQHIQEGGRRSAAIMQGVGIGIAGLGAAFLAVGGKEQQAAAGLKQSIEAAGGSFADYRSAIEETVKQQETFGHSANDTQDALSRLVQATNDPTQAINLMGLAANVAAARHISLTDAATTLAQGLAGNTRAFRQFGISLDGVGTKSEQVNRAFDQLNQKLAGQAQAQADTFSGRLRGMATHFEDLVASMSKFTPVLFAVGSAMTVVGAATDMLNKKRAEQIAVDAAVVIGENGVATAESRVAIAAAAAATKGLPSLQEASLAEGAGTRLLAGGGLLGGGMAGLRANLLKGAGIGVGGLVLGQVASAGIGGTAGSSIGNALSLGGSGAGLGFMLGGPLGAAIGGGAGALGGAVMGLFGGHHGPSHAQQQADLKKVLAGLDQQQTLQLDQQITSDLPGEFDVQGKPKAKQVAEATDSLAKAKTRLKRAQEDLSKAESKGADPEKLAAAESHLTAAQANLQKAQYVGGTARIASAQAAVDQAQAHISALHKGADTTSQQRRVADAQQAVTDAQQKLGTARSQASPLSARDLLGRARRSTGTERGMAADEARLGRFGLSQQFLKEVDDLDKQIPGTLHRVASTMTKSLARQINKQDDDYNAAAKSFTDAFNRAAKTPAEAVGANLAQDVTRSFAAKMRTLGFGDRAPSTNPTVGTFTSGAAASARGGGGDVNPFTGGPLVPGVHVNTVHVTAQNPQQLASALADQARHRALGGQTGLARP